MELELPPVVDRSLALSSQTVRGVGLLCSLASCLEKGQEHQSLGLLSFGAVSQLIWEHEALAKPIGRGGEGGSMFDGRNLLPISTVWAAVAWTVSSGFWVSLPKFKMAHVKCGR